MASGAFIDGKTALLLTPLVSSTCTLLFAHDQDVFLRIFTTPAVSNLGNGILPPYIRRFVPLGLKRVFGFLSVTIGASIASSYVAAPLLTAQGSLRWYQASAVLATAHLVFAPLVVPRLKAMMEGVETVTNDDVDETKKRNVVVLKEWLVVNGIRSLTTDLGAWVCCFIAVAKTFSLGQPN